MTSSTPTRVSSLRRIRLRSARLRASGSLQGPLRWYSEQHPLTLIRFEARRTGLKLKKGRERDENSPFGRRNDPRRIDPGSFGIDACISAQWRAGSGRRSATPPNEDGASEGHSTIPATSAATGSCTTGAGENSQLRAPHNRRGTVCSADSDTRARSERQSDSPRPNDGSAANRFKRTR
jgi:hypothetical protein